MATQILARNRINPRFDKVSGTKVESLQQIFGECFCTTVGYEEGGFSKLFFDPVILEFPTPTRADQQHCSAIARSNPLHPVRRRK